MWPQVALDMHSHAVPTSPLLGLQTWAAVLHGVIFNRRAQERKVREKAQIQTREVIVKLPKQELEDHTYHFRTKSVSIYALRVALVSFHRHWQNIWVKDVTWKLKRPSVASNLLGVAQKVLIFHILGLLGVWRTALMATFRFWFLGTPSFHWASIAVPQVNLLDCPRSLVTSQPVYLLPNLVTIQNWEGHRVEKCEVKLIVFKP